MIAVIGKFQYRVDDPKMAFKHPDSKDFKKLNKVVLKEGATNAAANRQMRQQHDLKVVAKTGRARNATYRPSSD